MSFGGLKIEKFRVLCPDNRNSGWFRAAPTGIPVGVHREMLNFVLAITFDSGLRLGRSLYRWKARSCRHRHEEIQKHRP